ncbi:hypothetical protein [Pseudomonas sp. NPDC089534]|uniref:hypothetical protein n=1 Tax=Pseudomonas sp. NPDC089534 TaxID=3364468 RepID=UPI0038061FBF
MGTESLISLIGFVLGMSVATERLVEIVKGFIPILNQTSDDPKAEGRRRSYLQILAVAGGVVTVLLSRAAIPEDIPFFLHSDFGVVCLGLLASGGSGFWNAALTYANQAKELKKVAVKQAQETPVVAPVAAVAAVVPVVPAAGQV